MTLFLVMTLVALVAAVVLLGVQLARARGLAAAGGAGPATTQAILDGAVDGIITIDSRGRIQLFNRAAENIFGWTAAEVAGCNVSMLMPEPDRSRHDTYIANYRRTGTPKIIGLGREVEGLRKDGTTFPMYLAVGESRIGRARVFAGIVRDITERRAQQEALRQAKEEAEHANLAKSKFLAAASHDLRQPVQALFFFAAALRQRKLDARARTVLDDLERSLSVLKTLLDSLLDVSRLDAGIVSVSRTVFSVDSVLSQVAHDFAPVAAEKNLQLRHVHSTAYVDSDPTLLMRIVQNLVSNAVRYTSEGRILIGCRRRGRALRIEIWDTGIGIAQDDLAEIFQEFYQVGNESRDRSQGLGLGLAIVQRLAQLLDHPVAVDSRPGKGSLFAVEVPLAVPVSEPQTQPVRTADENNARLVALIDDDPQTLRALQGLLEQWGYEVIVARSLAEATEGLQNRARELHAVIADYRLGEGEMGTEAIAQIRHLYGSDVRSILITGDISLKRQGQPRFEGLDVLYKPVEPPSLKAMLKER